ncbi:MAG: hypothetical protein LVR00_08140 [Rhabdochlamydiaceae bacterium]|jgi:hypothetical protein
MKKLITSLSLMSVNVLLPTLSADSGIFLEDIYSFLDKAEEQVVAAIELEGTLAPKPEKSASLLKEAGGHFTSSGEEILSQAQKRQRADAHAKRKAEGAIPATVPSVQKKTMPTTQVPSYEHVQPVAKTSYPLQAIAEIDSSASIAQAPSNMESEMPKKQREGSGVASGYNTPDMASRHSGVSAIMSGSFIYWKPQQDDFNVGITGPRPSVQQKLKDFHSKYEPGFKAGLGANFSYDNWVLYLEYTQLRTHQSNTRSFNSQGAMIVSPWVGITANDQNLYTPFAPTSGEILHSGVSNHWGFNFGMFDLFLSRSYYVGKKLVFNPFLAARGAKINQTLNVNFTYNTVGAPGVLNAIYSHNRNNTQQIGPRFGFDMNWLVGHNFRFGGTIAGALLYTQYQLRHTEILNGINYSNIHSSPSAFRFNGDVALEFGWRAYMNRNRSSIDLIFKYEALGFWEQNMVAGLAHILTNQGRTLDGGNLYLHGGTFKLGFNF